MSDEKKKEDSNYSKMKFPAIKNMLNIDVSNKDRKKIKYIKVQKISPSIIYHQEKYKLYYSFL